MEIAGELSTSNGIMRGKRFKREARVLLRHFKPTVNVHRYGKLPNLNFNGNFPN